MRTLTPFSGGVIRAGSAAGVAMTVFFFPFTGVACFGLIASSFRLALPVQQGEWLGNLGSWYQRRIRGAQRQRPRIRGEIPLAGQPAFAADVLENAVADL